MRIPLVTQSGQWPCRRLTLCCLGLFFVKAFLSNPLLFGFDPTIWNISDKSAAEGDWKIKIMSGHIYQAAPENGSEVYLPDYAPLRRTDDRQVQRNWGLNGRGVTDNPFFHGASWLELGGSVVPIAGFRAFLSIYAEHRGVSYGINSRDAIFVVPRYLVQLDSSFHVFGDHEIRFGGSVGDRRNARLHEGLMIDNIDTQGLELYIAWGKLRFRFQKTGDLVNQIGLNIDDLDDFSLHWDNQELWHPDWVLDVSLARTFAEPLRGSALTNELFGNNVSVSVSLRRDSSLRFYGQLARRFSRESTHTLGQLGAFVLGSDVNLKYSSFNAQITGEWRRYGAFFNAGYYDPAVYFRDRSGGAYNNTIGENIYPLSAYDYDFSQWSVYAEFPRIGTVNAMILQADVQWFFDEDFYLRAAYDLNFINHSVNGDADYLFQSYALGWQVRQGNRLEIGLSNKTMNLDKHYPTFYQFEDGFALELRANIAMDFSGNVN